MAKTSTKSVAIAQVLTQDQSTEFIMLFLKKTFKNLRPPGEIVCDEGKALLKALVGTFGNFENIKAYIAACMSSHLYGTMPPKCQVRIDRSHFVKNVTKKNKYRDHRKQQLFRGIFGFLIQCDSFETARKIILDLFTVILNENDGFDEFGVASPSEEARKRLNALCSTHKASDDYASDSDNGDEVIPITEDGDIEKDLNFNADSGWIDDVIKEVSFAKSENYHESVYFSGRDKEMYVKMLSSIALWSNIINPIFGSSTVVATSSNVESYFKLLKTGIIGRKMLRVDDFFEQHTDFVNAEIKLNAISNNKKRGRSKSLHERSPITPGKLSIPKSI